MNGAPWRTLLAPGTAVLCALAILIGLGIWQIERKQWKENLIAAMEQRLSAVPMDPPPKAAWTQLDRAQMEFRRVRFMAEFVDKQEALVFTSGSTLRLDTSGPGYWVFAPARMDEGEIAVNRGFVPQNRRDAASVAAPTGSVEITGVLRWPDRRSFFTPADDPAHNLWFLRDPPAIAASKGWGKIAPFYVEQEAPTPPGGLPAPGRLVPNLPNNHLQYAVTWFGLAAVVLGMFGAYAWGIVRK